MANRPVALAAATALLLLQCGTGQQAWAQYQGYQNGGPNQGGQYQPNPYQNGPNQGGQYQGGQYQGGPSQGGQYQDQGRQNQGGQYQGSQYQGGQYQSGQNQRSGNQMGYRMLTSEEAGNLPRNTGASLGLTVEATRRIQDQGLSFSILQVTQVRSGSPAASGGLHRGDNLIAVNGLVFPGPREFAQYVGSLTPGTTMTVDFIPSGSGPDNAQRVSLRVGGQGRNSAGPGEPATGMSTRMKLGLGAAALFGCYELGCFSSSKPAQQQQGNPQQGYQRP